MVIVTTKGRTGYFTMTEDISVSFETDVRNVMSVVKSTLGAIFDCLPKPLVSPHDVQVAFSIDKIADAIDARIKGGRR